MKKTILLASLLVVSWTAAFSDDDPKTKTKKTTDNYCAKMKDGMLRVEHDGTVLNEDVTLANGTQIKADGTIIKKDGTRSMLKEGQCVDLKGNTSDNFNGTPIAKDKKSERNKNSSDDNKSGTGNGTTMDNNTNRSDSTNNKK
jgi:hypothetical protein